MTMSLSLSRLPFSRFFRQLEQDMETVVRVLQPGPLGIIEHKFTDEEIKRANSTVNRAVGNWRRAAYNERRSTYIFVVHLLLRPPFVDYIENTCFLFNSHLESVADVCKACLQI